MKFDTSKRKLEKIYNFQLGDKFELKRKDNKNEEKYVNKLIFKKNVILYDSGWVQAQPSPPIF